MYVKIIYEQYIPYNLLGFVKISRMKIMYYFPQKIRENASYADMDVTQGRINVTYHIGRCESIPTVKMYTLSMHKTLHIPWLSKQIAIDLSKF